LHSSPLLSKRGASSITLLFTLCLTLIWTTSTSPAYAVEEIYIEPAVNPPASPYVGYKWNITIWIKDYDNPNVFSWQVRLNYDPAAGIDLTRAWNPTWDAAYIFTGRSSVNLPPAIALGTVLVGDSLLGDGVAETTPPNPAKLAIVEFQILNAPAKYQTLSTELSINNVDTFVGDFDNIYRDPIKTGGTYTWAWQPPPTKSNVAVQPSSIEFGSSPPPTGQAFNVSVMIENLDVDWGLTEANVTIAFNATVIDIVGGVANVTIDPSRWTVTKLAFNYNADPALDNITIHVESVGDKGGSPPKDELIAAIKFTVMYPGPWGIDIISPLDFVENVLMAESIPVSQNPPVNGQFVIRGMTIEVRFPPFTPGQNNLTTNKLMTFNAEVWLNDLSAEKRLIGVQFRLKYNSTLLKVLSVAEGPFLASFPNSPNPPYTWFVWYDESDPTYGSNVLVGVMLLPNATWQYHNFPSGSGAVATITFEGIYRGFHPEENNCTLELADILLLDDSYNLILTSAVNGYYEILSYRPPEAAFTYTPSILNATLPITFDASASMDFNLGFIANYTWNFGDGNITTVTDATVEHAYMAPITYTVNLTVTDDDGQTNSTTKSITVVKLTSTISIAAAPSTIILTQNTAISGKIEPTRIGVSVTIQNRLQGATEWQTLTTTPTGSDGRYEYAWAPTQSGIYELKASWDGDGIRESASSSIFILTVNVLADIAIKNVSLNATTIYAGWSVQINVTVKNEGMTTETFDVSVYYNSTNLIGAKTVTNLTPSAEITLVYIWSTTSALEGKNYQISAQATVVANEIDLRDNTFVFSYLRIKIMGDVTGDGTVDDQDMNIISLAFGSYPGHPRWNPDADLNHDGKIDLVDLAMGLSNYGKTIP